MSIFMTVELKSRMEALKRYILFEIDKISSLLFPFISEKITRYSFPFTIFKYSKKYILI